MQLSKYFTLADLTKTSQPYSNQPTTDAELDNLTKLAQLLDKIFDAVGPFDILSAFRSEQVNNAVGGVPTSYHRQGIAVDIYATTMSPEDFFAKIYGSDFRWQFGEIALKLDQNALHLSLPTYTKNGVALWEEAGRYTRMTSEQIAQYVKNVGNVVTDSLRENPLRTGIAALAMAGAASFFIYRKRAS